MTAGQAMYEGGSLGLATGGPLRPGGWALTERLIAQCELNAGDLVLDVGCGAGLTVQYLLESCAIRAVGLDRSPALFLPGLPLAYALATAIPMASETVDALLAECSLSSIAELGAFLAEARRVLRPCGRLAISDVYLREPAGAER